MLKRIERGDQSLAPGSSHPPSALVDLMANSLNPNKRLKEEFVSNITGSSMLEIAALSAIVPALVVLRQRSCKGPVSGTIYAKEIDKDSGNSSYKEGGSCTVALVIDFLFVIVPIVFIFTIIGFSF